MDMNIMNCRKRFQAILDYKKADALPVIFVEPYESHTLKCWREQGMPENTSPEDFLRLDRFNRENTLRISFGPIPGYEEKIISEDEQYMTKINYMGNTVVCRKEAPDMYYGHIGYPVKCRKDWLSYKERFHACPERYGCPPEDMEISARDSVNPTHLCIFPFFMRLGFYAMGLERFLTAFYDDPDLIHEMFSDWSEFILDVITPVLQHVCLDVVSFGEDLAFKNGSHISPQIYREFWLPYQNKIVNEIKKAGVTNICMYTSGDCRPLLPLMMENGINLTWPLDQYSNMDPMELRREYGKELRLVGGISKQILTKGPMAIDDRLDELMPLIREGGFIPAPDDMIPPEVPLKHVVCLIDKLRGIKL